MQAAEPQPGVDRIRPQAEHEQLAPSHHAPLAAREVRDRLVDGIRVTLAAYLAVNVTRVGHALKRGAIRVTCGLRA